MRDDDDWSPAERWPDEPPWQDDPPEPDVLDVPPEDDDALNPDEEAEVAAGPPWPLAWVERTITVDAVERDVVFSIEENPGWRFLHVGTGKGGQTTLTYGWPWPGPTP